MNKYIISLTYKDGRSETICGEYTDEEIITLKAAVYECFRSGQNGVLSLPDKWGGFNLIRLSELQQVRFYKEKENDLDKQED